MAKLSQLYQAYQDPNVRKFLNFIAQAEGVKHGYNTMFGNERFQSLGAHPNVRKAFTQTEGRTNYTTAAGRYQFLNSTWNNLARRYGFRDFSPQAQDLGAIALIAGRGALDDVLKGNWQAAIQKTGKEWASLPSSTYKQGKRSWDFANQKLGGGIQQPEQERLPTQKWADLTASNQRIPTQNWSELTAEGERVPTQKWSDLVGQNPAG